MEICKEEVGDAPRKPISNFWYFDTVVKNYASTLVKRGVGRSVSPAVCDCADPSHQFLRPHHTTITTNHNMQEKIPPRKNTPASPTKRLPKTPSTPSNKEGGADHKKDSEKARSYTSECVETTSSRSLERRNSRCTDDQSRYESRST